MSPLYDRRIGYLIISWAVACIIWAFDHSSRTGHVQVLCGPSKPDMMTTVI